MSLPTNKLKAGIVGLIFIFAVPFTTIYGYFGPYTEFSDCTPSAISKLEKSIRAEAERVCKSAPNGPYIYRCRGCYKKGGVVGMPTCNACGNTLCNRDNAAGLDKCVMNQGAGDMPYGCDYWKSNLLQAAILDNEMMEWSSATERSEVTELATSHEEWNRIKMAYKTPFIRTMKEFDKYITENGISNTPFSGVSKEDLSLFKEKLFFDSMLRDGKCYMSGLSSVYFGDLVEKYKWDEKKVFKVMELFGMDEKLSGGVYSYNKFCYDTVEKDLNFNQGCFCKYNEKWQYVISNVPCILHCCNDLHGTRYHEQRTVRGQVVVGPNNQKQFIYSEDGSSGEC